MSMKNLRNLHEQKVHRTREVENRTDDIKKRVKDQLIWRTCRRDRVDDHEHTPCLGGNCDSALKAELKRSSIIGETGMESKEEPFDHPCQAAEVPIVVNSEQDGNDPSALESAAFCRESEDIRVLEILSKSRAVDNHRLEQMNEKVVSMGMAKRASDVLGCMQIERAARDYDEYLSRGLDLVQAERGVKDIQMKQVSEREALRNEAESVYDADRRDIDLIQKRIVSEDKESIEKARQHKQILRDHEMECQRMRKEVLDAQHTCELRDEERRKKYSSDWFNRGENAVQRRLRGQILRDDISAGISAQIKITRDRADLMENLVNDLYKEEWDKAAKESELKAQLKKEIDKSRLKEAYDKQLLEKEQRKAMEKREDQEYGLKQIERLTELEQKDKQRQLMLLNRRHKYNSDISDIALHEGRERELQVAAMELRESHAEKRADMEKQVVEERRAQIIKDYNLTNLSKV